MARRSHGRPPIDLDPGETVTCTFTNTKAARSIVEKQTDPAGDPQLFGFTGSDLPGGRPDDTFNLADASHAQVRLGGSRHLPRVRERRSHGLEP